MPAFHCRFSHMHPRLAFDPLWTFAEEFIVTLCQIVSKLPSRRPIGTRAQ